MGVNMITVLFRRVSENLSWPIPGGIQTVPAFSRVRNELNGERPDPSRLPDIERGVSVSRTLGPVVMPRPFPLGTWEIYGIEASTDLWTKPRKVLTRAHQPVPIWRLNAKGEYDSPTGYFFDDWAYWWHWANGSHHTDGCGGIERYQDSVDFIDMVDRALKSNIPIQITCIDE